MDIYTHLINMAAQILAITNGTLNNWVVVPSNASGALDGNITLTTSGGSFVSQLAALAISATDFMSHVATHLFPSLP